MDDHRSRFRDWVHAEKSRSCHRGITAKTDGIDEYRRRARSQKADSLKALGGWSSVRFCLLDFVVDDARGLAPVFRLVDLEIREKGWSLPMEKLEHRDGAAADLELGALARSKLQHRSPGPCIRGHYDFRLGGVGKNSPRRLSRHFPAMDLIGDPRVALHEVLDQSNVALLRLVYLGPPLIFESLDSDDRRRDDEIGVRLVDVSLTELAICESSTMAHQLVGERSTYSLEQQGIVRVLEDASVPLLLDVLEVVTRRAVGRVLLAHIAETAGKLREPLAIGAFSEPPDLQMIGLDKDRTREKSYYWLCIVQETFRGKGNCN